METGLRGKTAVVTGSARGIGHACALLLARQGCNIVCADADVEGAARVAAEARATGIRAHAVQFDLASADAGDRLLEGATQHFDAVDVLINNAGVFRPTPLEDIDADEWDLVVDVNLRGTFLCSRAFLRHMRARGSGRIINVASLGGQAGTTASGVHYAASKAGVLNLTKSLAKQTGGTAVTVNAVNPGYIATDLVRSVAPEVIQRVVANTPLGRLGRSEEVAHAVVFLASDAASFIHGAHLDVNGGVYMA